MHFVQQIEQAKTDKWNAIQEGRALLEKVETEKRSINTEESSSLDKINQRIDEYDKKISQLEKFNVGEDPASEGRSGRPPLERSTAQPETRAHGTKEYRAAFESYLHTGERRDMTVGTQTSGGYLLAPVQTSADVIKQIDNLVYIKAKARTYTLNSAQAVGVRQMTSRVSDAAWTSEIGQLTPDNQLAFGRRDLTPTLIAKLVTASYRIFESGVPVEPIVNEELAYKFSTTLENAFLNGSGSNQPLGVFTASANGIPTSQDVTTSVSGSVAADDLIKMRYALKQPYLTGPDAAWMISRNFLQIARLMKDAYGQYLWRPGLANAAPDTLIDIPYNVSEYVPATVASGSYVAVLGNWKYYAIAQVRDLSIQRLNERYADQNEIGFIGRAWFDGAPVLGEAFSRLKIA